LGYVAANNSRETLLLFIITGMWSALQGSILLWGATLTDEEAKAKFPKGFKTLKPYLRLTPQPNK
jgi:hypothetical protein